MKTTGPDVQARARALLDLPLDEPARLARLAAFRAELAHALAAEDETSVRYGAAAAAVEPELCCPVTYDARALDHVPARILEVDYGCGDPSVWAEEGQTVLDLGSGSGKLAFMIARKVGPRGRVIGVDKTPEMLALARGAVTEVTAALGHPRPVVAFRRGLIENLELDLDLLDEALADGAPRDADELEALERRLLAHPMVADESVDLVVSSCVLNLVDEERRRRLFGEIFRVLRRGGSAAISDIVADRPVPDAMRADPAMRTGCLAGAFLLEDFFASFVDAGFHGVEQVASAFWKSVGGVNFHSVTLRAYRGKQGPCPESGRTAVYLGPFSLVADDDGHVFERGVPVPVCDKTAGLLARAPYAGRFAITPAAGADVEAPARAGDDDARCRPDGGCC